MASAVLTNASLGATRFTGSPLDVPKKAHALLAERFPAHRTKHKPLSILRQEGRRALEQFLDAQVPAPARVDRDKLVEEILGEAVGFGPLEELFRDETVKEVMLLAAAQVIVRKESGWVPTSVRFRDAGHLRGYVRRVAETGEPLVTGGSSGEGAFDVRMANGFRAVGVIPPDVLDQPPLTVLTRGLPPADPSTLPPTTASGWAPGSALVRTPPPRPVPPDSSTGSGAAAALTKSGSVGVTAAELTRIPAPGSKSEGPRPSPLPVPEPPLVSERYVPGPLDPKEQLRKRVGERIIRKCAAAGVYDLSVIPAVELQRVILAHVEELNSEDARKLTDQEMQIMALEIFSGMRR